MEKASNVSMNCLELELICNELITLELWALNLRPVEPWCFNTMSVNHFMHKLKVMGPKLTMFRVNRQ